MRHFILSTALVLPCLCAAAQAKTMQQKLEAVCADDIRKVCPEADAEGLKACMIARRAKVSEACMAYIDAAD